MCALMTKHFCNLQYLHSSFGGAGIMNRDKMIRQSKGSYSQLVNHILNSDLNFMSFCLNFELFKVTSRKQPRGCTVLHWTTSGVKMPEVESSAPSGTGAVATFATVMTVAKVARVASSAWQTSRSWWSTISGMPRTIWTKLSGTLHCNVCNT